MENHTERCLWLREGSEVATVSNDNGRMAVYNQFVVDAGERLDGALADTAPARTRRAGHQRRR